MIKYSFQKLNLYWKKEITGFWQSENNKNNKSVMVVKSSKNSIVEVKLIKKT